jgi:hypothetical protein
VDQARDADSISTKAPKSSTRARTCPAFHRPRNHLRVPLGYSAARDGPEVAHLPRNQPAAGEDHFKDKPMITA